MSAPTVDGLAEYPTLLAVERLAVERQRLMAELAEVSEVWREAVQAAGAARVPRARIAEAAGVTKDRVYQILDGR